MTQESCSLCRRHKFLRLFSLFPEQLLTQLLACVVAVVQWLFTACSGPESSQNTAFLPMPVTMKQLSLLDYMIYIKEENRVYAYTRIPRA